jgi:hypothetical protein
MKPVQIFPPPEGPTTPPSTTVPRLWPSLTLERQQQIAQCVAQLILRLRPASGRLAVKEDSDASPA